MSDTLPICPINVLYFDKHEQYHNDNLTDNNHIICTIFANKNYKSLKYNKPNFRRSEVRRRLRKIIKY